MKLPSRLLSGAPLVGFMTAFDNAFGRADTPWPYPVVVPSAVGSALLPFHCPYCRTVCDELVDPAKRDHYYDKLRKFCWCPCPDCRGRFFVDRKGMPLAEPLPAGAKVAPSRVEVEGKAVEVEAKQEESGRFDMLGAE